MRIVSALALAALLPAAAQALPRGVAPVRHVRADVDAFSVAAPPANAYLNYYGGHVLSNVHVVPVLWGNNVPSAVATGIGPYYAAVTNSSHMDFLAEYNTDVLDYAGNPGTGQKIGRGTAEAPITIAPSIAATSITNDQIASELQAQINAGHLPTPDANTLYMIHFPAGMKISMPDGNGGTASSCTQFCAYHNTVAHSPTNLFYGVIPNVTTDGCELGCGPIGGGFNNTTSVASHELVETITDAEVGLATNNAPPLAWYDPQGSNGEIGDICNGDQGTITSGNKSYTVQKEWSNTYGACVVSPASNDFAIVLNPSNRNIAAGQSATYKVSSVATSGTPGTIALSTGTLPTGITATFDKTNIAPGGSATLTVSVASTATNGANYFSIHGASAGLTHQSKSIATVSGGSAGGGGGGGNCPPGTTDIGGVCVPTGCSSSGAGSTWIAMLGVGALLFSRRRSRA